MKNGYRKEPIIQFPRISKSLSVENKKVCKVSFLLAVKCFWIDCPASRDCRVLALFLSLTKAIQLFSLGRSVVVWHRRHAYDITRRYQMNNRHHFGLNTSAGTSILINIVISTRLPMSERHYKWRPLDINLTYNNKIQGYFLFKINVDVQPQR